MESLDDLLPHVWLVEFSCATVTMPYLTLHDNSNNICYVIICVVDTIVYMGTVNNSNKTWHVLICVMYINNIKKLDVGLRTLEMLQLTHGVVLHHTNILHMETSTQTNKHKQT